MQQVLVDQADSFVKAEPMRRALEPALGQAILTAEGQRWRLQRRVAAPVFRPSAVDGFLPAMLKEARLLADRWAALPAGSTIDATHDMMGVTFDIILETMLSGRGDIDVARVERSMRDFLESTGWLAALSALHAPTWTPFPGKRRAERGHFYLRHMVSKRVAERRQTGERRDDLLSLMLDAKDPETGEGLDNSDIADNLLTFIAAGHETTALALTWTFYLLGRHPDVEKRVLEEIAQVTGGAPLEAKQVASLTYTRQVIPGGDAHLFRLPRMVVRQPTRDVTIGGIALTPAGQRLRADLRRAPSRQAMGRNLPASTRTASRQNAVRGRHRYAYLPFGAGPRICIGMGFALLEAAAILGTLLPRFHLAADAGFVPTPKLRVTMRPAEGMPLHLSLRAA